MSWKEYYAKKELKPSESLIKALTYFDTTVFKNQTAIDLGCGNGRDTLFLLSKGFNVYAIDSSPDSIKIINENISQKDREKLILECTSFNEANWRNALLINASYCLPFCKKENFKSVWSNLEKSIQSNGIFTGHFFGVNDDWKDLKLLERNEIDRMLNNFEILFFDEQEMDKESCTGPIKHWHIFEVIAKKK